MKIAIVFEHPLSFLDAYRAQVTQLCSLLPDLLHVLVQI